MSARMFILVHDEARRRALECVTEAPTGYTVKVSEPKKRRIQEEKYHAQIHDIARKYHFMGKLWHPVDMKRLLLDAYAKAMRDIGTPLAHDWRIVPSLDGERIVQLNIQSRDFTVAEASNFIEYLYAFGASQGVVWSEKARGETDA